MASVPVIRLGVLSAVRVGADAGSAAITVVPVAATNGMGMAAMLRARTFCMANTHLPILCSRKRTTMCVGWFRKLALIVELRPVAEQLRMRMSPVTKKSVK